MAGTARVRGLTAISALALASLAGCGGDPEPTAEEVKAAKSTWVQRVDAACRKANDAIADRGWPVNLVDLDRLVVRGIDDAQAAIKSISAQKVPEGAGPKPGAFVKELKALGPELDKLSEASEDLEPADLVKAAEALKPRLATIEKSAEEAGLSDCMSHDERFFVPDAVRAPVFAEQLARLDKRLLRRIKDVDFAARELARRARGGLPRLQRGGRLRGRRHRPARPAAVGGGPGRQLPDRPARPAVGEPEVHGHAGGRQGQGAGLRWTPASTCGWRSSSAGRRRAEAKTRRKMLQAVGAGPTMVPNEEAPESDSEQQS